MLTLAGIAFIGIGMLRYTPHPILHNVFARVFLPDERADDRAALAGPAV